MVTSDALNMGLKKGKEWGGGRGAIGRWGEGEGGGLVGKEGVDVCWGRTQERVNPPEHNFMKENKSMKIKRKTLLRHKITKWEVH